MEIVSCKTHDSKVDEEGGDMTAWLSLDDDDTMTELLDPTTESFQQSYRVRFIENPYSPTVIIQSSSGYVTINGNEESCGSSFSDSDSSVMVSIDRGSLNGLFEAVANEKGVAWGPDADEACGWMEDDVASWSLVNEMDGRDWFGYYGGEKIDDVDEVMWAKFLGED